ncbi:MAG TPA: DUF3078 domain-containing protein [Phnomibacter sp.]|nr:DUF3078 domain-containing protein [Phnomibacter sp.]
MRSRLFLAIIVGLFTVAATAQDAHTNVNEALKNKAIVADTSKKGVWKKGGLLAFNLTQRNSSNWIGVDEQFALAVGLSTDLYLNGAWGKNIVDNTFKASYGYTNNESDGLRKTSDFFDVYSKYGHALNEKQDLFLSAMFNLRSQFSNGYDYDLDPRRRISGFFAPANVLITPGLDWKPTSYFSLFFSPIASKFVVVSNDPYSYSYPNGDIPGGGKQEPIAETYGVDPEKKFDYQFGALLSLNFNKEVLKNVLYSTRADFYSNYLHQPDNIDMYWTNSLVFKVNKYLTLSYIWNLAYDHDYVPEGSSGPRLQFLGTFGIGVAAKF